MLSTLNIDGRFVATNNKPVFMIEKTNKLELESLDFGEPRLKLPIRHGNRA